MSQTETTVQQKLENCAAWHYARAERFPADRERHEEIADALMWRAYRLSQTEALLAA